MANKSLFSSLLNLLPKADVKNEAGGRAFAFTDKHALAQYAATGCLNATYYASADEQLEKVLALCTSVEPEFIAKTALFSRDRAFMKDMPALLVAYLSAYDVQLCAQIFDRVIDNGKMLRTFVQIVRSGVVGRKSLGTRPKKLVQRWFDSRSDDAVLKAAVGQDPSLKDVIRLARPKPKTDQRAALYRYLLGKEQDGDVLPALVQQLEAFKRGQTKDVPDVPFQMLTALDLSAREWAKIAENAGWQMVRMNLNTFARQGVFADRAMVKLIAEKLRDKDAIKKARALPYQLMTAYLATNDNVPDVVCEALQDAMETALENVPCIDGKVFVMVDVSGSMLSPITGERKGATTKVRTIDVAALVAAALVRKNPATRVVPFAEETKQVRLNPRDSVITNAQRLASLGGGGTNCSAPLRTLNVENAKGDLVVYVSDNESWVDATRARSTATMAEWATFRQRNPKAKLVCIDVQPYGTTQAKEREDILNVGGFSDQVFELLGLFANGARDATWVEQIERMRV